MIPFCQVEIHAQDCGWCQWPPFRISEEGLMYDADFSLDDHQDQPADADALQFEGFLFFVRSSKKGNGGNFSLDVAMKGSQEECRGFMIEASMMDVKSGEDKVVFKATFPPKPLEKVNKERLCLSVPHEVLVGLGEYDAETDKYDFCSWVKIVK